MNKNVHLLKSLLNNIIEYIIWPSIKEFQKNHLVFVNPSVLI